MRERFLQFVALVIGALGAVLLASGVVASAGEEAGAGPLADLSTFPVPLARDRPSTGRCGVPERIGSAKPNNGQRGSLIIMRAWTLKW